jgi:hypothetical protein
LANLKIQGRIKTPDVNVSTLAGFCVKLPKIAHLRDLSLLANETQDLLCARVGKREKMQLPIATASFQQKFDRENHPSPIQPHRLVASDWPIHILLSERNGLAKSGLIEMQQRPIKGGEISRKDAKVSD